jgi:integrase
VLAATEARQLLDSIDTKTVVGLRNRADRVIGFHVCPHRRRTRYDLADVYWQHRRLWVRLHEKGGKEHALPCHHNLESYLQDYIEAAGLAGDKEGRLFRTAYRRTGTLTNRAMTQSDAWRMLQRRAREAGIPTAVCNHTFRATGTAYLDNGGSLEMPKPWPPTRVPAPPSSTTARMTKSRSTRSRKSEFKARYQIRLETDYESSTA